MKSGSTSGCASHGWCGRYRPCGAGVETIRSSGIGLGVERNNPSKYADRRDLRMQGGLLD